MSFPLPPVAAEVTRRTRKNPPPDVGGYSSKPASTGPRRRCCTIACGFALLLTSQVLAGGVVTNSSLTRLYAALLGGGHVTFETKTTNDFAFSFAAPIEIASDTILDATTTTRTVFLSGGDKVRLFNVRSNVTLTLLNLNLVSGQSTNGGAIYNERGVVVATDCVFSGHAAVGPDGADGSTGRDDFSFGGRGGHGEDGTSAYGGAIHNLGRCELIRCQFENNRATGGDGGDGGAGGNGGLQGGRGGDGGHAAVARGGAVYNAGTLLVSNCTFAANTVIAGDGGNSGASGAGGGEQAMAVPGDARAGADAFGGAIFTVGNATFLGCTFHTNTVTGGAAANEYPDPSGWGRAGRAGGSVYGGAIANEGTLALTNCTFVANAGTGGNGGNGGDGAVFRGGKGGDGGSAFGGALWSRVNATLVNVTFVGGAVTAGSGGTGGSDNWDLDRIEPRDGPDGTAGGGNVSHTGGTLTLSNCLLASAASGGNGFGELTDAGHNLSSDDTCEFGAAGSLNNTDPKLGDLGAYGGSTETVPLLADSPAINAGTEIPGLPTDQRGVTRPQGTAFDIGAFERPFAGLSGVVRRSDGTPFPGVVLTLISATAGPRTTTSGADGRYEFTPQPGTDLGVYRIEPPSAAPSFLPAYWDVELTGPSESITGLDFTAGGERIVSFGFGPDGLFRLRFLGAPSKVYRIEATAPAIAWQELARLTTDAAGSLEFTDPAAPADARLYRVVAP